MPTQDHVQWNTLERVTSEDLNDMQDTVARGYVEMLRGISMRKISGTPPTGNVRVHLSAGLLLYLNAGVPTLSLGWLGQQVAAVPPLVPTPGTRDSTYRIGYLPAAAALADPWDATSAWWLLQARVQRTTTLQEVRDVYDPATLTFAPGPLNDKWYDSQVVTAWKKGGAATIPAPDAGYAPIAAMYRPIGGGVIADTDIVQLSIQIDDLVNTDVYPVAGGFGGGSTRKSFRFRTTTGHGVTPATVDASLSAEVGGYNLFFNGTTVGIRNAAYVSPGDIGDIAVDGLWWYLYLAKATYEVPSGQYRTNNIQNRGVLVASRTPPTDYGVNSDAITLPDPVGTTAAIGEAAFVGVFRASGAGANVHYIDVAADGVGKVNKAQLNNGAFAMTQANGFQAGAINMGTTGAGGTEDVPFGVHLQLGFESVDLDTGAVSLSAELFLSIAGDGGGAGDQQRRFCSFRSHYSFDVWVTPRNRALTLTITATARADNLVGEAFDAGHVGTNEAIGYLMGIRF